MTSKNHAGRVGLSLFGVLGLFGLTFAPMAGAAAAPEDDPPPGAISGQVPLFENVDLEESPVEAILVDATLDPVDVKDTDAPAEDLVSIYTEDPLALDRVEQDEENLVLPIAATATLEQGGGYSFEGLSPGDYLLKFQSSKDAKELVNAQWWVDSDTYGDATVITVEPGETVSLSDAKLTWPVEADVESEGPVEAAATPAESDDTPESSDAPEPTVAEAPEESEDAPAVEAAASGNASISGKITVPDGESLADITIYLFRNWDPEWHIVPVHTPINPDGTWQVTGLEAGTYRVVFQVDDGNLLSQAWNNKPSEHDADEITLAAGQNKTGVNADMKIGATISGTITVPAGESPEDVYVTVRNDEGGMWGVGYPDESGHYSVQSLHPGTYTVEFSHNGNVLDQWWNNKGSKADATRITVTYEQEVTGVNADLIKGATISGKVTSPGHSVEFVSVRVYTLDQDIVKRTQPDATGNYSLQGLPAGNYKVLFFAVDPYGAMDIPLVPQWWNNKSAFNAAGTVTVPHQGNTTGINADLVPGTATEFVLVPKPIIDGVPQVGGWLSETDITFMSFAPYAREVSYQWLRDGTPISGATDKVYQVAAADAGKSISVRITGEKPGFPDGVATSNSMTIQVVDPGVFSSVPTPVISGVSEVGQTLSVTGAGKSDFVPAADSVAYQWLRGGSAISGATGSTYKLVAADEGKKISVRVVGSKAGYSDGTATSNSVTVQAADPSGGSLVVKRLSGANRYLTNLAVNNETAVVGGPVFVASGGAFPDALSAGPAVRSVGGSLFLTPQGKMPQELVNKIASLNPSKVYIIGGVGAVSDTVSNQLRSATARIPERISGKTRYETSMAVFKKFFPGAQSSVFIATGRDYPDALTASAVGGALGAPVLLVNGKQSQATSDVISLLRASGTTNIQLVGGKGAVSAGIEAQLKQSLGAQSVGRLSGADRYATNMSVNTYLNNQSGTPAMTGVWLATGKNFPDALSGAVPAGHVTQRLVLSNGTCIPKPVVTTWIKGSGSQVTNTYLVGGTGVLSNTVQNLQQCA